MKRACCPTERNRELLCIALFAMQNPMSQRQNRWFSCFAIFLDKVCCQQNAIEPMQKQWFWCSGILLGSVCCVYNSLKHFNICDANIPACWAVFVANKTQENRYEIIDSILPVSCCAGFVERKNNRTNAKSLILMLRYLVGQGLSSTKPCKVIDSNVPVSCCAELVDHTTQ